MRRARHRKSLNPTDGSEEEEEEEEEEKKEEKKEEEESYLIKGLKSSPVPTSSAGAYCRYPCVQRWLRYSCRVR